MVKLNCWEFMKCGREGGGCRVGELGACPAYTETRTNGLNGGLNGGRACWAITGTFCFNEVQETYAQKLANCIACDFYRQVMEEEGKEYKGVFSILSKLQN